MKRSTGSSLMKRVEDLVLRDALSFEGQRRIGLRYDESPPDPSVFAVVQVDAGDVLAVARVHESELDAAAEGALHFVYMTREDLALLALTAFPTRGPDR